METVKMNTPVDWVCLLECHGNIITVIEPNELIVHGAYTYRDENGLVRTGNDRLIKRINGEIWSTSDNGSTHTYRNIAHYLGY